MPLLRGPIGVDITTYLNALAGWITLLNATASIFYSKPLSPVAWPIGIIRFAGVTNASGVAKCLSNCIDAHQLSRS